MIEINLLPDAAKRQRTRVPSLRAGALPKLQLPTMDRPALYLGAAWVVGIALLAFMHLPSTAKLKQLDLDVQAAQRDSARLGRLIVMNDSLNKQIQEVGARLDMLQQIDAGRYVWAHILDEIARALPQYTWLINITDATAGAPVPAFKIEGRTGNTFALAKFMQDLESSPFIQNVQIRSQSETQEDNKRLYAFILEMQYEEPQPDDIETQPLFSESGEVNAEPQPGQGAPPAPGAKPRGRED